MIELNAFLLFQWIIFILLMIFLNQFLFKPVLRVVDARREKVEGTRESADQLNARAARNRDDYETRVAETRARLDRETVAVRDETAQAARQEMDRARGEAARLVEDVRGRIEHEYDRVRSQMKDDIKGFAGQISAKILGRNV
ncbi:MAG: ATP synthase F0 subunit B [Deltaproteobacteria bacterium]|nr:ATP synthase F0 subunit B [Candidatus Anaeroferrophillacea bacterium]